MYNSLKRPYWALILLCLCLNSIASYSQTDGNSDNHSNCGYPVAYETEGTFTVCFKDHGTIITRPGFTKFYCGEELIPTPVQSDGCFSNIRCCPDGSTLTVVWTTVDQDRNLVTCTDTISLPDCPEEPCKNGDSDGDGVCDDDECEPFNPKETHAPGDPCDDGNPKTYDDIYTEDCICKGIDPCDGIDPNDNCPLTEDSVTCAIEGISNPTECYYNDKAAQSISFETDCKTNPPSAMIKIKEITKGLCKSNTSFVEITLTDSNGQVIQNDTYWHEDGDTYNTIIIPDLGKFQLKVINACTTGTEKCEYEFEFNDCVVINTPPDPNDGCALTTDIFDEENCTIENIPPNVDDGCEGTYDYFDETICEVIHELLPCDDGDPTTVGDQYNEKCECEGCDPCDLEGPEWELLCDLLNR